MSYIIRTDVSKEIGIGHFIRCLALAEALIARKQSVSLVCHSLPSNYQSLCLKKGITVHYLPIETQNELEDATHTLSLVSKLKPSWIIVDNYKLGLTWQQAIRSSNAKLMVIDDFADSKIECDLLLSQNYPVLDYTNLISPNTITCLGLKYVLLRSEFYKQRLKVKKRDGNIKRILVSFGGSDYTHSTLTTLKILSQMKLPNIAIDVVTADLNSDKELIKKWCESLPNFHYHHQTNQISRLIVEADLALGSGGSTHWERCFLGLPAIVNVVAENQVRTTNALAAEGRVINLGFDNDAAFQPALLECLENPHKLRQMSEKCLELIPYNPTIPLRVVEHLC